MKWPENLANRLTRFYPDIVYILWCANVMESPMPL